MTTVLNAYIMPAVDRYLRCIEDGLTARGFTAEMKIMRSDAGVMSLAAARRRPVNTVLSGPAGGVSGATYVAAAAGYPNIVTLDMGGPSTDVCLSTQGEPRLSTDTWVSQYPIKVPIVDVTTIGAGGGSIALVSSSGAVRVGPESAGADPGPVCYGQGGDRPTVTDATSFSAGCRPTSPEARSVSTSNGPKTRSCATLPIHWVSRWRKQLTESSESSMRTCWAPCGS